MSQYFPKPYEPFGGDINIKVDLSNYATKADIKHISHVDTSSFAWRANLASLKTEVDKLDIDKLVPVPVPVVVKKTVNSIDTSEFDLKTKYDADKSEIENYIPNTCGFVKKAD